jgi:hypothetical protein
MCSRRLSREPRITKNKSTGVPSAPEFDRLTRAIERGGQARDAVGVGVRDSDTIADPGAHHALAGGMSSVATRRSATNPSRPDRPQWRPTGRPWSQSAVRKSVTTASVRVARSVAWAFGTVGGSARTVEARRRLGCGRDATLGATSPACQAARAWVLLTRPKHADLEGVGADCGHAHAGRQDHVGRDAIRRRLATR